MQRVEAPAPLELEQQLSRSSALARKAVALTAALPAYSQPLLSSPSVFA